MKIKLGENVSITKKVKHKRSISTNSEDCSPKHAHRQRREADSGLGLAQAGHLPGMHKLWAPSLSLNRVKGVCGRECIKCKAYVTARDKGTYKKATDRHHLQFLCKKNGRFSRDSQSWKEERHHHRPPMQRGIAEITSNVLTQSQRHISRS